MYMKTHPELPLDLDHTCKEDYEKHTHTWQDEDDFVVEVLASFSAAAERMCPACQWLRGYTAGFKASFEAHRRAATAGDA